MLKWFIQDATIIMQQQIKRNGIFLFGKNQTIMIQQQYSKFKILNSIYIYNNILKHKRNFHLNFKIFGSQTKSSGRWLNRQRNDIYVKQAKQQGYRSRAAFKLIEINEKCGKFLEKSKVVVDLGAAPGSWSQVVLEHFKGKNNKLITIDILEMEKLELPKKEINCEIIQLTGKFEENINNLIKNLKENEQVDLVLSDMAPNTCGNKSLDHQRIIFLCKNALDFCFEVLKPGGNLLMKLFSGSEDNTFKEELKQCFTSVKVIKPSSSRSESNEMYIYCEGFKV